MEADQPLWNEPSKFFRVSGIGNPCIRSMVFSALGHNVPFEAKTLRIFAVGTSIGEIVANTFKKRGVLIDAEKTVVLDFPPIRGRYDIKVEGQDDDEGEEILGEVKSINDFGFDKLPEEHDYVLASESPLIDTYRHYVMQWNTYAQLEGLEKGFIIFEAKNTQRHKVYFLRTDAALYDEVIDKTTFGAKYLLEERIPPIPKERSPHGNDPVCNKCSAKYLCELVARDGDTLENVKNIDKQVRG